MMDALAIRARLVSFCSALGRRLKSTGYRLWNSSKKYSTVSRVSTHYPILG
jgi:hypothetical protein